MIPGVRDSSISTSGRSPTTSSNRISKSSSRARSSSKSIGNIKKEPTALHSVVKAGCPVEVSTMIKSGAKVNALDIYGCTALHFAPSGEIARLLLDAGAYVDVGDLCGQTALFQAAYDGNVEVVSVLIEYGAEVNAHDQHGFAPLHSTPSAKIVKLLVEAGADIDARDELGRTALFTATTDRKTEVVSTLLELGADVEIRDDYCRTALDYSDKKAICKLLRDASDKLDSQDSVVPYRTS